MGVAVRKMFTKGHWSGGAAQLHDNDDGQVHSIVPGGGSGGGEGMVISPIPTPPIWSLDHTRRIIHVSMVISPNKKQ